MDHASLPLVSSAHTVSLPNQRLQEVLNVQVTPDDFDALKGRLFDEFKRLDPKYALPIFDRLIQSVEGQLVITEPGGVTEWLELVTRLRVNLESERMTSVDKSLERISILIRKYWKPASRHAQRPLPFILNAKLREVAEDDWSRAVISAQREDAKTTAISAGSVVEAMALDVLESLPNDVLSRLKTHLNNLPKEKRGALNAGKPSPATWTFAYLIFALSPNGVSLITQRTHDIGQLLRDWRNFVHPSVSRDEEPLSAADGRLAIGFAEKVIEEVERWHAAGRQPLAVPVP